VCASGKVLLMSTFNPRWSTRSATPAEPGDLPWGLGECRGTGHKLLTLTGIDFVAFDKQVCCKACLTKQIARLGTHGRAQGSRMPR
jgi:hypothetical protein